VLLTIFQGGWNPTVAEVSPQQLPKHNANSKQTLGGHGRHKLGDRHPQVLGAYGYHLLGGFNGTPWAPIID